MSTLPSFSLSDTSDVDEDPEGFIRPVREDSDVADRRSRLHCVRWSSQRDLVVMKEVHLWEEDTVTCDVHTVAARIHQLQSSTCGATAAQYFVGYLALHIDTPHHYQWLLRRCGPSLKTLLDNSIKQPCFTEDQCKHILRCVLTALHHLHSVCGFIHGDLSLSNVFTHLSFELDNQVLLGDLETLTPIGAEFPGSQGTLLYTSPERLQDGALPCSTHDDVWAFGIIAYQLFVGSSTAHPWCSDHVVRGNIDNFWTFLDAVHKIQGTPSLAYLQRTPLATWSPDAMSVVTACLSWQPDDRPTAATLLQHSWFSK